MPRRRKKYKDLPRRIKKKMYIRLKNRIRRTSKILGGKFYTHDYIHGDNHWVDVYFLGKKVNEFYNATLSTAEYTFAEEVRSIAFDRSIELLPYEMPQFVKQVNEKGGVIYRMQFKGMEPKKEFGGLTRSQWEDEEARRIVEKGEVSVREHMKIDRSYRYGIGLSAVIHKESITIDIINEFIDKFNSGEYGDGWEGGSLRFGAGIIEKISPFESNRLSEPEEWGVEEREECQHLETL